MNKTTKKTRYYIEVSHGTACVRLYGTKESLRISQQKHSAAGYSVSRIYREGSDAACD